MQGYDAKSRVMMRNPEGNRPLRRPRHSLEHNVTLDLREIGWGDVEWVQLTE
jgi:hypothetical protein